MKSPRAEWRSGDDGTDTASEVQSLRRTLRDVVALSALPSIWVNYDLPRSLQNLTDVLRAALRAHTVCVRVKLPDGTDFSTAASNGLANATAHLCETAELLDAVDSDSSDVIEIAKFNGSGPLNALPHPLFFAGQHIGQFVACYKVDVIPSQSDRLLLQVAANQVTLLFQRHKDQEERFARRLAEDQLRQAEHHYQQLIQSLPAAVYTCDTAGRITLCNEAAVKLWGFRPKLGEDMWYGCWKYFRPDGSAMPPDERPMAIAIREGRSVRGLEMIVERRDGTRAWVLPHPDPIRDQSGRILGFVNMLVEIDELKRAEQKARANEARIQTLLTLMPAAVYACDAEGRFTFYNRRAVELWAWEPKLNDDQQKFCAMHKCWFNGKLIPPEGTPMAVAVREGKAFRDLEPTIERPDGTKLSVLVNIDPLFDANGKPEGAINVFQDVTALKNAEAELRRKNSQLATFLETAALGLHRVGPDGTILWANAAEMQMLGYSPEEYIGHHIAEFHADEPVVDDILRRLSCGEALCEREARLRCKDGSIKHVLIDSSVLREDGRFIHTQCFTRDITETKRAQQKLRETNERLKKVLEIETVGVMFWDLTTGRLVDANDTFLKMMGYSRADAESRTLTWEKFTPPEYHEISRAEIAKFASTGRVGPYEKEYFHKDGTRQWLLFAGSSLGNNLCVEFCVDISKRKRVEESAARLAAIVEHSDDAIFSTDLDGTISSWNRGAERLYGYTEAEAIGKSLTMLLPAGRADEEPAIIQRIRNGESVENYETERRRKDGTVIDVSLTVSPVKDGAGKIIGVSKVARDISDEVRAKEKLEQTVTERTGSLREAIEQMEEFSYSVSHDLRSPLRAMNAYAGVLLEEYGNQLDEVARGYLAKIQRGSDRMNRLTQDVLAYSRVARSQVQPETIDLERLVRDVIYQHTTLQPPATEIEIVGPLPPVLGHETTLAQSISNLLNNAVKFVAAGVKPHVRVHAERKGKQVRVWFEDNGIGIKPEHQQRIFNMFERVHPEGMYEGTGIGLTIVRKAIEKMGGKVGVESEGHTGSRFWIELRQWE
jgi:PAS domain S-box-containing protein